MQTLADLSLHSAKCPAPQEFMKHAVGYEFRYTLRRLRRSIGFTLSVSASFAVGITSLVSVAWLADTLILKGPALLTDPARVVAIGEWRDRKYLSYPDYVDFAERARSFDGIAAFSQSAFSVRFGGGAAQTRALLVSHNFLNVLGVHPLLGRDFSPADDIHGAPHVVMVSAAFWRAHFDKTSNATTEFLEIGGEKYPIVGVLPSRFTGADLNRVDLLLPITTTPSFGASNGLTSRATQWVRAVGRLRKAVSSTAASQEATSIYREVNAGNRAIDPTVLATVRIPVTPVADVRRDWSAPDSTIALWLVGLGVVLLGLTCVNVASLFVARQHDRRKSDAINLALGATRARLFGRVLYELIAVVLAGGVLALLLSVPAIRELAGLFVGEGIAVPGLFDSHSLVISLLASGFALAVCVVITGTMILRAEPIDRFRETGLHAGAGSRRVMRILLGFQIAAAAVLVTGAQLFALSLRESRQVQFGMALDHLVIADLDFQTAGYDTAEVAALVPRILARLKSESGVVAAGVTNAAVFPSFLTYTFTVPSGTPAAELKGEIGVSAVTADFFAAVGMEASSGAPFSDMDVKQRRPVIVVSEAFAEHYWQRRSPIGQCVAVGGPRASCNEVVGVMRNRRGGYDHPGPILEAFVPFASPGLPRGIADNFIGRQIAIQVRGSPVAASTRLAKMLSEMAPRALFVHTAPAWASLESQQRNWRIGATVLGGFGIVALALAAIGVFALAKHSVAGRNREFAIRRAVGADSSQLIQAALRDIALAWISAIAVGLVGGALLARAMAQLLYGVSAATVMIYAGTLVILGVVALLAVMGPVGTVLRIEPSRVLNAE